MNGACSCVVVVNMLTRHVLIFDSVSSASFLVNSESTLHSRALSSELSSSRAIIPSLCTYNSQSVNQSGNQSETFKVVHTHNRFTALLESVQDYPGEQVPER